MTLWVEKGATIMGSPDAQDWHLLQSMPSYPVDASKNSNPRFGSLIHGYQNDKIRILGHGKINGNGPVWWKAYRAHQLSHSRPFLVELMECSNIEVGHGLTLTQSPFWTLHFYGSSNIVVSGLHVDNDLTAPNTDGMDIDSSQNVWVTNSTINTADDHIAIKSGYGEPGRNWGRPSRNILIEKNMLGVGAGLAIGSETAGSVKNVTIRRNEFSIGAAKYAY
jgi:polygalacturonase